MTGMRLTGIFRRLRREELGVTSIVVVLLMTVLMVSAAFIVDIGAIQARKAQLQDAADAAALAIAQECFEHPASSFAAGCAPAVVADSNATATELAEANLNDRKVTVLGVEFPTVDTVRVTLTSAESGYFGQLISIESTGLDATATAEWNPPTVPLSLAFGACAFPDPGEETVLQASLAVSPLVSLALDLDDGCGLLTSAGLLDGLSGTVGIVSGGWLTTATPILGLTPDDCSYDPNLLTTVAATVSKLIPPECASAIPGWGVSESSPQRVLLPVFDNGVDQLLLDDVFGVGDVDRYAIVDITGYSFTGLLGIGSVSGSDTSLCLSSSGGIGALLSALPPGVLALLGGITGCQALEGTFIGFVDAGEAAAMTSGVRLVE